MSVLLGYKLNAKCQFDSKKWNIMSKEILTFGNIEIEENTFYRKRLQLF